MVRWRDFGLAFGWLILDQVAKVTMVRIWTARRLTFGASIPVIPGFFQLTLSQNRGGLFGWMGMASDPWRKVLLTGLPLVAVVVLAVLLARIPKKDSLGRVGLALILGGAAGNLLDRLVNGVVVDMFDLYANWTPAAQVLQYFFDAHHWPTFNVADIGLTSGAALLIVQSLRRRKPAGDETNAPVSP